LSSQPTARGLNIGVTGHRLNRISQRQLERLTPQVTPVLRQIARLSGEVRPMLVSSLAEGADRHLARLALDAGFGLHALLPFERQDCLRDFPGVVSRLDFSDLLARAEQVTELPGRPGYNAQAYHRAGQALLEQSDLLLAVWDGEPARGPGGTAEVVEGACRRRMPVVHVSTRHQERPVLLWQRRGRPPGSRPASEIALARVVSQLTRPLPC
jgi:hypothetical protein